MATRAQLVTAGSQAMAAGNRSGAERLANMIREGQFDDAPQTSPALIEEPQEQVPDAPVDFDVATMVSNLGPSAVSTVKDMVTPLINMGETAEAVTGLVRGGVQKGVRNVKELVSGEEIPVDPSSNEASVDQVIEYIKQRYGGIDELKTTLMEDPVGLLTDFAGTLTTGGAATGTKALSTIGRATTPVNVALNVPKAAVSAAVKGVTTKKTAPSLYESAMKPSTTLSLKDREKLVKTALDERLAPTYKGVDKLETNVTALDSTVDEMIKVADAQGVEIPVGRVMKHMGDLHKNKGGFRLGGKSDQNAIRKFSREVRDWAKSNNRTTVTTTELQAFKQSAYKDINWDAKRLTGTPIKEEIYQAMARAAKEGIEEVLPEIKGLNQRMGDLIDLKVHLQRAANRIENRDVLSLGMSVKGGTGGAVAGVPGMLAGTLLGFLDTPKVKARAAIIINDIRKGSTLDLLKKKNLTLGDIGVLSELAGRLANAEAVEME